MKKNKFFFRVPLCVLLTFVLLFSSFFSGFTGIVKTNAASKKIQQRTIAIVYDNSGSMFDGANNTRWCQAQYAIEIFASMMNQGDKMLIYPMRPMYLNAVDSGTQYNYWSNPYVITSDAQKTSVRNFITDHKRYSDNTPIESLDAAYSGLENEEGEKWLIVMTDGATFNEGDSKEKNKGSEEKVLSQEETRKRLGENFTRYLSSSNVIYLGIGDSIKAPVAEASSESYEYISKITSAEDIPVNLTVLCNRIFGRDQMPKANANNAVGYTENSLTFDISLSKLYLFVQGKDISNIKVTNNKTGATISATKTFLPKYGELGHATTYNKKFNVDESRQGCIAVYENLEPGTYSYTYQGTMSDVACYYEPDVDLKVVLSDPSGNIVKDFSNVQPGNYLLNYMLVDARDASKPVESILLGDVYYDVTYNLAGKQETSSVQKMYGAVEIQMEANQSLTLIDVEVSYLNGYRIRKTGPELGFPSGGILADKADAKAFEIVVNGGKDIYEPDKINEEGKYTVTFKYDGAQITGSKVDNVTLNADSLYPDVSVELERNGDSYIMSLKTQDDIKNLEAGTFGIYLTGTYDPEIEKPASSSKQVEYSISEIVQNLSLEIVNASKKYVITDLKKGKNNTMKAIVKLDGQDLTDEQLENAILEVSGAEMNATRIDGESAYLLTFSENSEYNKGEYTITAKISNINDRKGRALEASDSVTYKLQKMQSWAYWLIVLGIILLIAALVLFILTRKVLPWKFELDKSNTTVTIDGSVQANQNIAYSCTKGIFKRDITIEVKIDGRPNPIKATLKANDYLFKPSKKRKYIIEIRNVNTNSINNIQIGSREFNVENQRIEAIDTNDTRDIPVNNDYGTDIIISGKVDDDRTFFAQTKLLRK